MLSSQKMNLDYIRTFVVLGQSANMTEASRALGIDVSNVSRHVKKLEELFSTKLVIPGAKNQSLQLTEEGKYFFEQYEKIYNRILLVEKDYRQSLHPDNCKITIGVCSELEEAILTPKILQYKKQFPNLLIKVVTGNTESLTTMLMQYNLDLVLNKNSFFSTLKRQSVQTKKLVHSNYCFFYLKSSCFDLDDLSNVPFIFPVRSMEERAYIEQYFLDQEITPFIPYEVSTIYSMISYVEKGLGVGVILKDAIIKREDFEIIDIALESEICISYMEERLTPSTKQFLKLFVDNK